MMNSNKNDYVLSCPDSYRSYYRRLLCHTLHRSVTLFSIVEVLPLHTISFLLCR